MEKPLNYHQSTDKIATSGQPTRKELFDIAAEGYKTMVNLAMHDSDNAIADEGSIVASLGMSYFHIPVPFDAPSADHLRTFIGIMETQADRPVWVHCAVNARVSAFMYQYLTKVKGISAQAATSPLLAKWRPRMDDSWQKFIGMSSSEIGL